MKTVVGPPNVAEILSSHLLTSNPRWRMRTRTIFLNDKEFGLPINRYQRAQKSCIPPPTRSPPRAALTPADVLLGPGGDGFPAAAG